MEWSILSIIKNLDTASLSAVKAFAVFNSLPEHMKTDEGLDQFIRATLSGSQKIFNVIDHITKSEGSIPLNWPNVTELFNESGKITEQNGAVTIDSAVSKRIISRNTAYKARHNAKISTGSCETPIEKACNLLKDYTKDDGLGRLLSGCMEIHHVTAVEEILAKTEGNGASIKTLDALLSALGSLSAKPGGALAHCIDAIKSLNQLDPNESPQSGPKK